MSNTSIISVVLAVGLIGAPALAQRMPDIGFPSVGRGRPLAASVLDMEMVGPDWVRPADAPNDANNPFPLNAFVEPVRIVRDLHKTNAVSDSEAPYAFVECVQTIFAVAGESRPLTPGAEIQYEIPDMYGRPWAAILERYFEEGMSKPDTTEDLFNFGQLNCMPTRNLGMQRGAPSAHSFCRLIGSRNGVSGSLT